MTVTCSQEGEWNINDTCVMIPDIYDIDATTEYPEYRFFNLTTAITLGWKLCLTITFHDAIKYLTIGFYDDDTRRLWVHVRDSSHDSNHYIAFYNSAGSKVNSISTNFGKKQYLRGLSRVSLSLTLVDIMQLQLDIGPPVNYTFTTNRYSNYIENVNKILLRVVEGGMTVYYLNLDCTND